MKAILLSILLAIISTSAFAQKIGTESADEISASILRSIHSSSDDEIYELTNAVVQLDSTHVFKAASANARISRAPLGGMTVTAANGTVFDETTAQARTELTDATLFRTSASANWEVQARSMKVIP